MTSLVIAFVTGTQEVVIVAGESMQRFDFVYESSIVGLNTFLNPVAEGAVDFVFSRQLAIVKREIVTQERGQLRDTRCQLSLGQHVFYR